MSDVIQLLPDSVANQIAAGEVIQRPASVIKELVENAVDAGATSIQVILRDAGKTLIQVVDNGCGMSETDARLAFERHATSKIRQAQDLFTLHTMGFRGEALPSIAAVAQVELTTMRPGDTLGTRLCLAASRFESQQPEACAVGTNLQVKNLFFNFPARRKFLKKDAVELVHILHEFERLALVNPQLELTLIHNDVTLHQLMGGSLKQRISSLFGKSLEKQLIPVHTETSMVKIDGFVSLPEHARRRNALQYFFVNGRNMRHPYFHKAVLGCYEELISAEQQPNYFLNFEVDPQTIDVNIHPTKSEIKFENETPIWGILTAAIRESLGKFNAVPAIDFDQADAPDIPAFNPDVHALDEFSADAYNPFAPAGGYPVNPGSQGASAPSPSEFGWRERKSSASDWEKLYQDFQQETPEQGLQSEDFTSSAMNALPDLDDDAGMGAPTVGTMTVAGRYLLTPARQGVMVVDRYRAHLNVLFHHYMALTKAAPGNTQQVFFAETVSLTPAQQTILRCILPEAEAMGFALTDTGDGKWEINGLPASLGHLNGSDLLMKMIDQMGEGVETTGADELHRLVALAIARSSAVRAGQPLGEAETERLLADLFSLPTPAYTPDGNPVFFLLTADELARRL